MSSRIVAERLLPFAALIAALATPSLAKAEGPPAAASPVPPQDAAVAQSLFDEARTLMLTSRFAEACPKLAESERLDPALGTLLNLAVCNERLGKTASAWGEYRDAESVAKREGRAERATYAHDHAAVLEPRLSRLVITRARGNVDRGLNVTIDGETVGEAAFGSLVPIDPGAHRVEAKAAGKKPWSSAIVVDDFADKRTLEIPSLEDAPAPATVVQGMSGGGPLAITLPSAPPPEQETKPESGISRRTAAYVVGGVGVTALAFGGVAGMQAIVKWNDRQKLCNGDTCSAAGVSADGTARSWALASDIGLGVGAVAMGAAAYLFFTSKGAEAPAPAVRVVPTASATGGGLGIDCVW